VISRHSFSQVSVGWFSCLDSMRSIPRPKAQS